MLLRHVNTLNLLEDEALREIRPQVDADEPVPLAIAVNADSLATWLPDVFWHLINTRDITLEVVRDDQEHTLERLLQGDVMGCVSSQRTSLRGFNSHPLGVMVYRCYAAPGFARRWFPDGLPAHAARKAPAVLFDRKDTLHSKFMEQCVGVRMPRYPCHYLPDTKAVFAAVQHSAGYSVLPCLQVAWRTAMRHLATSR
ncbi:LysR substrate-binding domain-containing protein [Aquincola sp. MAHUQ-54]|uniref:LysR substrate-binding domain-containing protein n=1 Tax=Aquincola agrisoli TaxID=3119538 RepID=A0AAW9QEP0_9BURK